MINVIIRCIPLMIGAAVVPVWITIVFLLLRSKGGLVKAVAFVGGQLLVRFAQGIAFGYEFGHSTIAKANIPVITNTILLVAGILLWITAVQQLRKERDPDEPPPRWLAIFHTVSPARIFMIGAAWTAVSMKQWIFALGALGIIYDSHLPSPLDFFAFLIFLLGAQSLMLVPIVMTIVAPNRSSRFIDVGSAWVERNNRRIVIAVSVIFGAYFLYKGFTGLFG